jgi:RNase H-fold protein (predicted Holliday junction resolvase)
MNLFENASAMTPTPSLSWLKKAETERLTVLKLAICTASNNLQELVEFLEAKDNGYVVVSLKHDLGPGERGTLLLDLEDLLKEKVDIGLTVWLEPQKDKSALRKLRGIEVKK